MTTMTSSIGASLKVHKLTWDNLPWEKAKKGIYRLQMRIAKATQEGKFGKVKALQRLLTTSFYAKCLAVKRVTSNKGSKTPGIDGILWKNHSQKMHAILSLRRRNYRPLPLKRIFIPKRNGKLRPLSIPTLKDRAMQALWHLALDPIAEQWADPNAYGFRQKRSAHDAIEQCYKVLCRKSSAQWIFEGDIKSCFDNISHSWLLENIPMDNTILSKFLKAGFMQKHTLYPTEIGVPQGGIIAPTLALMALSGLERKLKSLFKRNSKVHIVSYADDFIITAASKELLSAIVIPVIQRFLKEVGLELSEEKSKITHINEGFNFLGCNIKKYNNGKLLIKPAKANIKSFLTEIRKVIKANYSAKTESIITILNPKIIGWANYFRSFIAKEAFTYVNAQIYKALWVWMKRRHPNQGKRWITRKYFRRYKLSNWQFYTMLKNKQGEQYHLDLKQAKRIAIRRHIKIKSAANPYDPKFLDYFKRRESTARLRKVAT